MPKLSVDELVLDRQAYAERRPADCDRMIPLRRERRLRLGDQLVCEFEQESRFACARCSEDEQPTRSGMSIKNAAYASPRRQQSR